jgi:hypothetical protein
MLPLGYEAARDDRSPTRMPVFDWTLTPTPSTTNNDSQVIFWFCISMKLINCCHGWFQSAYARWFDNVSGDSMSYFSQIYMCFGFDQ